jgi:protein-S-isoprenylcysteine O-methyltransferase Ste14
VNLLKTAIFFLFVPGTFAGWLPWLVARSGTNPLPFDPPLLRAGGILLCALGASGLLWCVWEFSTRGEGTPAPFDPPKRLVVRGLYRFVRNPMYVSVGYALLGEAIVYDSRSLLIYLVSFFILAHLFVVLYEEPGLKRRFGAEYRDYLDRVPRWIPRLSPAGARS